MVFLWANIVMTVETGSLFPEKFGLNPEQVGLQNISLIVGSLIGELMGGFLSDWWMWRRQSKNEKNSAAVDSEGSEGHHTPQPEFRLWVGYPGLLLAICGVVVYLVQLDRAGDTWNITPIIGAGIAAVGNQIVTTVATTYAVDCYRESAADVGVFVCFVRQMWGFIGPFWFPQMVLEAGFRPSAGIATAMLVGASLIPMVIMQWKGRSWR
jgi:MFS family permease